ncbi:MAG: DUF4287 domain-containing protein [Anaerolineales bacterium]
MKVAGVSDEAVKQKTGKGWGDWLNLLDEHGAFELNHTQIAKFLHDEFNVSPWWAQKITGGYEQERKGRQVHEMAQGFEISRTRTWPFPLARVLQAWLDKSVRREWLPEKVSGVRETTSGESLWMEWADGMRVNVRFVAKGPSRTSLTVEHSRIPDAEQAARLKQLWKSRLSELRELLAGVG